jgi:hypothetical protein
MPPCAVVVRLECASVYALSLFSASSSVAALNAVTNVGLAAAYVLSLAS